MQRVGTTPWPTTPVTTTRYPFVVGYLRLSSLQNQNLMALDWQFTLNQGAIEVIFLDAMKALDLKVDRQTVPLSLHISEDEAALRDASAYPVQVRF